MEKRKLELYQQEREEEKRAKRLRSCQYFESSESQDDVASLKFDLDFDPDVLTSNLPFIGEVAEEWTEVNVKDSLNEGVEIDRRMEDGKDNASSSYLLQISQDLFLHSLEPEATGCIDESDFSFIREHEIEEEISLSEQEVFAMDVVQSVWDAWRRRDVEAMDEILVAVSEEILKNPFSLRQYHCVNFIYISKKIPDVFRLPKTYKVLLKLLSSGMPKSLMNKPNLLPILASKLLYQAFVREMKWPLDFIQAFLGDVVGPCAWIEHDSCKEFVGILSSAFQDLVVTPSNRYASFEMRKMVQKEYFMVLSEVLKADSTRENSLVLLKLLMIGSEYEDARLIASSMMERWINNPVYIHSARDLLGCIVQKTFSMSKSDHSTVANLFLLKIKDQHSNIYSEMVTQLLCKRREYAAIALKTLVLVGLSVEDISSVKSICTILKGISVTSSPEHELATILQELAANDNTRIRLKGFVCRLIGHIGSYINIKALCESLLQPWAAMAYQNESLKVTWLKEITELVTIFLLHSAAAFAVDENVMISVSFPETSESSFSRAASEISNITKEKLEALQQFSIDLAMFQLEAIEWCMHVVAVYAPNMNEDEFAKFLKHFLFLGDRQSYFPSGKCAGEIGCNSLQLLGSCTGASEEILARLILIGISDIYPLSMGNALSIIESLVWRAAAFHKLFHSNLHAESNQLPSAIIKLASFNLPGLPQQSLTHLVLKDKYWQACMILLLIAIYNPGTIGQNIWEQNSNIRQMMGMVITGSPKFFSLNDETAGKLKVNDLESKAMTSDAKAEESIYSLLLKSNNYNCTVSGENLLDTYEWRGNVTLLNSFGILERLPERIIKELEEADKVYKLGRELRQCRPPDFFAQITGTQTLSKAWVWLRGILCQEPEIVPVLPFLWQCELLYLNEALVARGGKHFVHFKQLYLTVCKVIIDKSHEKEVEAFVEHLSCKLADKCSFIRCQARRCFANIFDMSFAFLREQSLSQDSGQGYFTRSNTYSGFCNIAKGDMLSKPTRTFSATANYDLRWLEEINGHPNAHAIISSLLPAIQNAVQVETTIEVVIVYLTFLEKHSPPFPSVLSFACTVLKLLVQRREFAACLFSRKKGDLCLVSPSSSVSGKHTYIIGSILNFLYEALCFGTACQSNNDEVGGMKSPLVKLVVPRTGDRETKCLQCIMLHKIVLDAVLRVLCLWSNMEDYKKSDNVIIENMIQLLLPNVDGNINVAWLESKTGQKLPLLSNEQAIAFSRSKDDRIAFAGCSALSEKAILQLCLWLGLPPPTVDLILEVLDLKAGFRIQELLQQTKDHQAWILQASLQALSKSTTKSFQNLSWILSQVSSPSVFFMMPLKIHKSVPAPGSITVNGNEKYGQVSTVDIVDSIIRQIAISDLSFEVGFLRGVPDLTLGFGELRKCIQREVCCDNNFLILNMIETSLKNYKVFEDHRLSWVHLSFSLLPSLALLINSINSNLENFRESHSETEYHIDCEGYLQRILIEMETERDSSLDVDNVAIEQNISTTVLHARFIVAELQCVLGTKYAKPHLLCQESLFKTMHVNCQVSCSLLDSSYVSFMGVEGSIRTFLQLNLKQVWSESWLKYQPDFFTSELLQFMFRIVRDQGDSFNCIYNLEEDDTVDNQKCIMMSGYYGLFSVFLKFLDLSMNSNIWTSFQFPAENDKDVVPEGPAPFFMPLFLENIVDESSWQVKIKVLKAMLEYFGKIASLLYSLNNQRSKALTAYPLSPRGLEKQVEVIAMLDFLYTCSFHPRTVLVDRCSALLESEVSRRSITMPLIRMLSVHCLVNMTSQACASIRIIDGLRCSFQGESSINEVVHEYLVSVITVLLVTSASESPNKLHAIIEHLLSVDCGDVFMEEPSRVHGVLSNVVKELLWTVYFTFPLSVCGISQFDRGTEFFTSNMLNGFKVLQTSKFLLNRFKQALPLYRIVQKALKIVCQGNEKESDTIYAFCHHLAKNHPVLVLPHILMLAALLKEKIPGMTKGECHLSSFGHALYLVLGLIDALRPHILDLHNNSEHQNIRRCSGTKDSTQEHTMDVQKREDSSKGSLEVIMDVYFEVLDNLHANNLSQFLKVVIRCTDFLCHCVVAGKYCLEVVVSRRELIETTARKFSKIKKLAFLLSLIDKLGSSQSLVTDTDELLKRQYHSEDTPFGPSFLPVDAVLKVQSKLQHFLSSQKDDSDIQRNTKNTDLEDENNLLSVLGDVEKASARVPTLLTSLEGLLIELTEVQNKDARKLIFQLLERLLLHCPSKDSSVNVLNALLHNLKSRDISLAKMAAEQAVKFFYHCPELQEKVLVELFLTTGFAKEDLWLLLRDLLLIST